MATHGIPDDILAEYASGNLNEAFSLVVAAHVSLSDEARTRLDAMERIGGALLEASVPPDMTAPSLDAALARIRSAPPEAPEPPPARLRGGDGAPCDVLPAPVRAYVGGGIGAVRWRSLGMGAKQAILQSDREASVRLLYIPAGCEMPDHGHRGTEMTLVLKGAFLDGDERFARGDVEIADEDTEHRPVADVGEDCICLAACEGALKFSGLLPRIAQPFFRI